MMDPIMWLPLITSQLIQVCFLNTSCQGCQTASSTCDESWATLRKNLANWGLNVVVPWYLTSLVVRRYFFKGYGELIPCRSETRNSMVGLKIASSLWVFDNGINTTPHKFTVQYSYSTSVVKFKQIKSFESSCIKESQKRGKTMKLRHHTMTWVF